MAKPLFDEEGVPSRNDLILKDFLEHCDNQISIYQCYKNKLELNVKYNINVERKIKRIEEKFIDKYDLPWWLELLD